MQELGADEAIDYTSTNFEDVLKANPVDVVVDPMAGTDPIMRVEVSSLKFTFRNPSVNVLRVEFLEYILQVTMSLEASMSSSRVGIISKY